MELFGVVMGEHLVRDPNPLIVPCMESSMGGTSHTPCQVGAAGKGWEGIWGAEEMPVPRVQRGC